MLEVKEGIHKKLLLLLTLLHPDFHAFQSIFSMISLSLSLAASSASSFAS